MGLWCKIFGHDVVVNLPVFLSRNGEIPQPIAMKECIRCGEFLEYVPPIPADEKGRIVGRISWEDYEEEMEKARKRGK